MLKTSGLISKINRTFLLQGVRPRNWWEANRAKRATWIALVLWSMLLLVLWFLIHLARR